MVGEEFEIITSEKHLTLNVINPLKETVYLVCSIIWYHWHNQKVKNEKVDDFEKSGQKVEITILSIPIYSVHRYYYAILSILS